MNNKNYRFMSGLPRSGTTLLSAILSQNPDVYLTPQSDLSEHLRVTHQSGMGFEDWNLGVLRREHTALLKGTIAAFYSETPQSTIIDKSRRWGNPYFVRLLTDVLGEEPRILCPVRPLAEVVASFIRKAQENPETNYIDRQMISEDFLPYWRKPVDDARTDWLLSPNGMLNSGILSVHVAMQEEAAHMFHIYSYNDLVTEPQKTLDGIYDFIGVDRFQHDLSTIPMAEKHNDAEVLGIPDLHSVRDTLSASTTSPEEVLSDYALTRCMIEDFWTPGT